MTADPIRLRLFLRLAAVLAALTLADGVLEYYIIGAVHELALAAAMFSLIAWMRVRWRRKAPEGAPPFIAP